jgi:hypothetical protein
MIFKNQHDEMLIKKKKEREREDRGMRFLTIEIE